MEDPERQRLQVPGAVMYGQQQDSHHLASKVRKTTMTKYDRRGIYRNPRGESSERGPDEMMTTRPRTGRGRRLVSKVLRSSEAGGGPGFKSNHNCYWMFVTNSQKLLRINPDYFHPRLY